jgi:dihydrofolate reductase
MTVNAIMARDLNNAIGYKGDMPWPRNKADMKWFKDNTLGDVVLMGRTTWLSIGEKALPGRTNVVVTSKKIEGPIHVESGYMEFILDRVKAKYPNRVIWVIGGADIYEQAFQFCDKLYITTIKEKHECDRFVLDSMIDRFSNIECIRHEFGLSFEIRSRPNGA